MKRKMRTILFTSWLHSGKKTIIYLLMLFLTISTLACSLFFYRGNSLEESLANSMELSLSYENQHYFSNHDIENGSNVSRTVFIYDDPEMNHQIYNTFLEDINQFMENPEIVYGNYNLVKQFLLQDQTEHLFFGISSPKFFEREGFTITEGTEQINDNECIVSERQKIEENGTNRFVQIGDTLTISIINQNHEIVEAGNFQIVGKYHQLQDIRYVGINDDFINSDGIVITNQAMKKLLDDHPEQYGCMTDASTVYYGYKTDGTGSYITDSEYFDDMGNLNESAVANDYVNWFPMSSGDLIESPTINHIEFLTDSINKYVTLQDKFNAFTEQEINKISDLIRTSDIHYEDTTILLQQPENKYRFIVDSVHRIEVFYQIMMSSIFIMLVISIYAFLNNMQAGKKKEIFIYYSLGKNKFDIVKYYVKYYLFIAIPISILGCLSGHFVSSALSHRLLVSNLARQKEFIHAQTLHLNTEFNLFQMDLKTVMVVSAAVLLISLLMLTLFVSFITYRILHERLRDHSRGGN